MSSGFAAFRKLRARRRELEERSRSERLRLWQCLDPLLGTMAALGFGILLAGFLVYVGVGESRGWFDPPLVRPVADERLLTNLRDDLARRPLVAATFQRSQEVLWAAQRGGRIHRCDPEGRVVGLLYAVRKLGNGELRQSARWARVAGTAKGTSPGAA